MAGSSRPPPARGSEVNRALRALDPAAAGRIVEVLIVLSHCQDKIGAANALHDTVSRFLAREKVGNADESADLTPTLGQQQGGRAPAGNF